MSASAKQILDQHWDGKLPVDALKIAKSMGVNVVPHDFPDDTVVEAGFLDGEPTIRLSRAVHQAGGTRANFAIAHSLGHVTQHREELREIDASAAPERAR